MSWVTIVSRSARERSSDSSRKDCVSSLKPAPSPVASPNDPEGAAGVLDRTDVVIVSERRGMLSFFVRRIEAPIAFCADFRALCSGCRGTSRFILFSAAAD